MTHRYLLCPGLVSSRTDRDLHYISARKLAFLYGVPMDECLIADYSQGSRDYSRLMERARAGELIALHPRWDGDYKLPEPAPPAAVPAVPANPYGCHNRLATAAPDCQYTLSALGRVDPRCTGCRWRAPDA